VRDLLDTSVLSELVRREPDAGVVRWVEGQAPLDLSISVLTIGELAKGVESLAHGDRRTRLEHWLSTELPRQFLGRLVPVDDSAAREWGRVAARGRLEGRELPVIDGLLLAAARVHGLTLVTRNERDCADRGVPIHNPWS